MANERITENIVRNKLRQLGYYDDENIVIEEQQSKNPRIQKQLKTASKSGTGGGYPEFIISFIDSNDLMIIIECKADTKKHESKERENYKDYAVDGVLLYASYLSKEFDVLAIAVSGQSEKELKISHFLQLKNSFTHKDIQDKSFLGSKSYKHLVEKISKPIKNEDLIKKAIEYNNDLHNYSIPETERCTFISSILTSLQHKAFLVGFLKHENNEELIENMLQACGWVLENNEIVGHRQSTILQEYSSIKTNVRFKSKTIKNKKSKEEIPNTILKDLIIDLRDNVLPFVTSEKDFDILGKFYTEFIRYAGDDKKTGLVLTPIHITEWFCELANLQSNDRIYDPCCGTGGFLVSAMSYMMKKSGNNQEEYKKIKSERLFGVEIRPDMFTHACSNMMMRGDGKSNIYHDDCFKEEVIKKIKNQKPNKAFLNPPYDVGEDGQLEFVENALNCITKNGICIAICQMSTVVGTGKAVIEVRKRLLENHTLEAVFSMPDDLFHPIGVITCVMLFTAHQPHPERYETFFGYFKDDGFVKKKNRGRIDGGTWKEKKRQMLDLYQNKKNVAGLSVTQYVKAEDEWCAEAYMETDYSKLTEEDFIKTIKDYVAFQFLNSDNG